MRDRLIDGLIQGDRLVWAAVGALWLLTTAVVLLHRPRPAGDTTGGPRRFAWIWLLFAAATATSLAGIPLSSAIAVPRVRWATVDAPDLLASGGDGWRRLRGPAVLVEGPDLAIPTVDATDHWILVGLLSGKPIPGLPAAEPAPMKTGAARLCLPSGESCRPWPVSWPDPTRPMSLGELGWSRPTGSADTGISDALAYDTETGLYLRRIEPAPGTPLTAPVLELMGRLSGDPPREGGAALFVARKVAAGRLKAVRVIATPAAVAAVPDAGHPQPPGHAFHMERAEVSLTAGPRAFTYVRPLLVLTSLSLPLGVLVLLLAPLLHRRSWPGSGGARREAAAWIAPALEAAAVLSAGIAAAAPAVVALASLWGSR